MTEEEQTRRARSNVATLAAGVIIALAMVAAFLWGESHGVNTMPLLAILSPIVGALLIMPKVDGLQRTTDTVARNTNGHLTALTTENAALRAELERYRAAAGE